MKLALTIIGIYLLLNAAIIALAWIFGRPDQRRAQPRAKEAFPCAR